MIELYTWSTPNGRKISIALEEMGIPYELHAIDIGKDMQFEPEFLKISPNNKIPAIRDTETGQTVFESAAILIWLGDKFGKFLPKDGPKRTAVMEWLMWQVGGFGPMLGQAHHFLQYNPGKAPYAEERSARRQSGSMACWTGDSPNAPMSRVMRSPSPISPSGPGPAAMNGSVST